MSYTVQLIEKKEVATDTMAFYFSKPQGFMYKAGQSIDLTLINPSETDEEGNTRAFSLVSAPYEDHLMITTRMRDTAFKRVLKELPLTTELTIDGPFGSFTLHNDTSKIAVFLTGGVGITPVYSMIKQSLQAKSNHSIFLFYSNHTPADTAYLSELQELAAQNSNLTFVPTMTQVDGDSWQGEKQRISAELMTKYITDFDNCIFYICGPANMVTALRAILESSTINEDNIRTEDFPGY